jgi:membrane-associated phospholipid phosphatase
MNEIQDIISTSTALLYVIPVIGYIISGNIMHIKGLLGLFATLGIGESAKHYLIKESSPRPKGAYNCNLWCNDGHQEGKPGMPSGHSSQVTFFSSFYYQQTTNVWVRTALVLYAVLVMISRYVKRCHTIPQIISGSLLGLLISKCVI